MLHVAVTHAPRAAGAVAAVTSAISGYELGNTVYGGIAALGTVIGLTLAMGQQRRKSRKEYADEIQKAYDRGVTDEHQRTLDVERDLADAKEDMRYYRSLAQQRGAGGIPPSQRRNDDH